MNRFGATVTAGALLLSLAACGSDTKPAAATASTPAVPTSTPTPTPTKADPTATAKTQVLAAYAAFIVALDKGYREGGVTYPYEKYMTEGGLETVKNQMNLFKGIHRAKVTGNMRLIESRISDLSLSAKPQISTVTACVDDQYTAVSRKTGKNIAEPGGKLTRIDKLKLIKGKWMVFDTRAEPASYGCTK
ncbi:hypothetical protein GCM10029976_077470 [Kribbella albertanoniae]|uniref:Nuclear transport factor 2 family protein n=1 Tax=Kribbella albertanoniae TaxID=1266829 RepID=A0A4R4Q6I4_9ACTN|nr:hypothetical protein [Kribbella albertanoniae]TDC30522.1 hypothetical protein E1261_13070 [Kribbella albertanoniae]